MASKAEHALETWIERMKALGHSLDTTLNSIAFASGLDQWNAEAPADDRRKMLLQHFRELEAERP